LVGAGRFERPTPCAQGRCATRLRYAPTCEASLILNYLRSEHPFQNQISVSKTYQNLTLSSARFIQQLRHGVLFVLIGKLWFIKTPVVYAGIELNSLDNIDVRDDSFAADFFLWFRYQDDLNLDPQEVEFPTVVSGATLGKEVGRRSRQGFTTVTYHVKGVFRAEYEFSRFPFDEQTLKILIQFHNSQYSNRAVALMDSAQEANPMESLEPIWRELLGLTAAVHDLDADKLSEESFNSFRSILQIAMDVTRDRRAILSPSNPGIVS
jgi:hypothetical protein